METKSIRGCCGCCRPCEKSKWCSGCKKVWYCSTQCQADDWKVHKPLCKSDGDDFYNDYRSHELLFSRMLDTVITMIAYHKIYKLGKSSVTCRFVRTKTGYMGELIGSSTSITKVQLQNEVVSFCMFDGSKNIFPICEDRKVAKQLYSNYCCLINDHIRVLIFIDVDPTIKRRVLISYASGKIKTLYCDDQLIICED